MRQVALALQFCIFLTLSWARVFQFQVNDQAVLQWFFRFSNRLHAVRLQHLEVYRFHIICITSTLYKSTNLKVDLPINIALT